MPTLSQRFRLIEAALRTRYYQVGAVIAALTAHRRGVSVRSLAGAALGGSKSTVIALSILVLVGSLIGERMAAGTVPTLVYCGLLVASPRFLVLVV